MKSWGKTDGESIVVAYPILSGSKYPKKEESMSQAFAGGKDAIVSAVVNEVGG